MRNKMLLRIFILPLATNLTLKSINTINISDVRSEIIYRFGPSFAGGAVGTPFVNAVPVVAMSVSDIIKERSKNVRKFLKILKRNSNTSLRVFKHLAAMLATVVIAGVIYESSTYYKSLREIMDRQPIYSCCFGVLCGAHFTSWLGQKLTKSKKDNLKNEDKKETNKK